MQINADAFWYPDGPSHPPIAGDDDTQLAIERHVLRLRLLLPTCTLPYTLRRHGWQVHEATTPAQARLLNDTYDFRVGLLELGTNGLTRDWQDFLIAHQRIRWIALLDREALDQSPGKSALVKAIHDHCRGYHLPPFDSVRLSHSLDQIWGMALLPEQHRPLAMEHQMVGRSESMRGTLQLIPRLAAVDAPVLIQGESGTGKELAAQAIHECSDRANRPFVAVNCGALPSSLVHSELFGHERGAFSGASHLRIGRIESANGGTLFLDEIGDLPLELQVNLLRFLQQGTIERLGSSQSIHLNVRVIAATHVDMELAIAGNRFREDLYYRLNVLRLTTPPLRDRPEDIPLLAEHAFRQFRAEGHRHVRGFSHQAMEAMQAYHWPGNVREIINRVRRAIVLCDYPLIRPSDLELDPNSQTPIHDGMKTLAKAREDAERATIQAALSRYRQNHSLAARGLGVSRATLYRLLQRHT